VKERVRVGAVIGLLILALVAVIFGYKRYHVHAAPHLAAASIPKHPRILSSDAVEALLAGNFQLVYEVDRVPDAVRKSFENFVDWPTLEAWAAQQGVKVEAAIAAEKSKLQKHPHPPLNMADPGQEMSSDDLTQGLPIRRLILCGFSSSAGFVLYQQAGYVSTVQLAVFDFGRSSAWGGWIKTYDTRSLDDMRNVMKLQRYRPWDQLD
jgi:hypothetical protein